MMSFGAEPTLQRLVVLQIHFQVFDESVCAWVNWMSQVRDGHVEGLAVRISSPDQLRQLIVKSRILYGSVCS